MKKDNKPRVTYTKNGKEITKTICFFNESKIWEDLLIDFNDSKKAGNYIFSSSLEIEFIHFKNVVFLNEREISFESMHNQIVIFENCVFSGRTVKFENGNIQVINPIFIQKNCSIIGDSVEDLSITLEKNYSENEIINLKMMGVQNFSLDGDWQVKDISVKKAKNIFLTNVFQLDRLHLEGETVTFGEDNHMIVSAWNGLIIDSKTCNLNNVKLIAENSSFDNDISIHSPNIIGTDWNLMATGNISLNENIYKKPRGEIYASLSSRDFQPEVGQMFAKTNITAFLRALRLELQQQNEDRAELIKAKILEELDQKPLKKVYKKN